MCLWFYNIILPTLPHFRKVSSEQKRGEEGKEMREEKEKGEEKTFYLSKESKIILTGTEITNGGRRTSKNIPPTAIALENVLNVWCLTVWHFKWYIEAYKIYLVVCFGLALTTFSILGFGNK